jgi:hypothetical protein
MAVTIERGLNEDDRLALRRADSLSYEEAATYLRTTLPHRFIYLGGHHIALHAEDGGPRLAMITYW